MKTVITIEDGRITVEVDDGARKMKERVNYNGPDVPEIVVPIERSADPKPWERPAQPPSPKPPVVETKRIKLPPAPARGIRTYREKPCASCGKPFDPSGPRQLRCDDCRDATFRPNSEQPKASLKDLSDKAGEAADPDRDMWCVHCQAFTDHLAPDHPDDLPIVKEKVSQGFTPKDDRPPVKVFSDTGKFLDPWTCEPCRSLHRLCGLHKFLTDSGKKPPLSSPTP